MQSLPFSMIIVAIQGVCLTFLALMYFRNNWYVKQTQGLTARQWQTLPSFHRIFWSVWCWNIAKFLRENNG